MNTCQGRISIVWWINVNVQSNSIYDTIGKRRSEEKKMSNIYLYFYFRVYFSSFNSYVRGMQPESLREIIICFQLIIIPQTEENVRHRKKVIIDVLTLSLMTRERVYTHTNPLWLYKSFQFTSWIVLFFLRRYGPLTVCSSSTLPSSV